MTNDEHFLHSNVNRQSGTSARKEKKTCENVNKTASSKNRKIVKLDEELKKFMAVAEKTLGWVGDIA